MIDSHCHLDVEAFDRDRSEALVRAWAEGIEGLVIPALGPDAWDGLLVWPKTDGRIQVALGIHPRELRQLPAADDDAHLEVLDSLLAQGVACAVGACGLDGPSSARAPFERQLRVLDGHLRLAHKHHLPLLLHCQRAHRLLEDWLDRVRLPERGAVLHGYSGGAERVPSYQAHGLWFGFGGRVTWPDSRRAAEALRTVPVERLLVETGAPDQTPAPHRSRRSEPAFLVHVVEAMARHRGERRSELAQRMADNARRFFDRPFQPDLTPIPEPRAG